MKYGAVSIMLWGHILYLKPGLLVKTEGRIDGAKYKQIIQKNFNLVAPVRKKPQI